VYSTFQSHEPEFDYLKSLEIEEKINRIQWLRQFNQSRFLLSANGWKWCNLVKSELDSIYITAWLFPKLSLLIWRSLSIDHGCTVLWIAWCISIIFNGHIKLKLHYILRQINILWTIFFITLKNEVILLNQIILWGCVPILILSWCVCLCKTFIFLYCTNELVLVSADKTIKLWKLSERCKRPEGLNLKDDSGLIRTPTSITTLQVPVFVPVDMMVEASPRRVFANAHAYHINSVSINSDEETFLSADDLRINLWNTAITNQSFSIL